ncbi:LRR domain containing protein [Trema orientale]|uniref:LRR domain containing protein n=1 Tax=Trema orientale TaxID=63057 RepID=A0A2P5C0X3_TREOI|nr:LRR domain containing protein [Trema orientale]
MDVEVLWMTLVICFCFKAQAVTPQNLTCDPNDQRALQDFTADSETVIDGWGKHIPHPIAVIDSNSNDFSGLVPTSIHLPSIQAFGISQNSLNGSLPSHIYDNSSALRILKLAVNYFSSDLLPGPVPDNLPSYQNLNNINLARNFIGQTQIPESPKNFKSLYYLSLSNNNNSNLSSALKILQQCENLTALVLSLNFCNKELPAHLAFHFGKLRILIIANCGLRDSLPHWLSRSSLLELLDIS